MEDQSQAVCGTTYVTYDKDTDKTTCTILCGDSNDTVCGKEFNGQFATNLKKHL